MKRYINNLKDYAELAQASYFYFDLLKDSQDITRKIYDLDSKGNKIKDETYPRGYKEIEVTLEHIVSKKYKGQEVLVNLEKGNDIFTKMKNNASESFNFDKLDGKFTHTQARNFAKRYEIKYHQPNTSSGFSATLFQNKESKEYILAIRGTEGLWSMDIFADAKLSSGSIPQDQYFDMLLFYQDCIQKNHITKSTHLTITGHSLGVTLAQLFALSFATAKSTTIIKELYTFDKSLESRSVA